ncbi:hypothetical protein AAEP93_010912 [Penicillium crustosum]
MSHGGPGFLYYRYTYRCPWKSKTDNMTGTEEVWHTAIYTPVTKQSHEGQTAWFKNRTMDAIEKDVTKCLANQEFGYREKLPPHTEGKTKGEPFGKRI